jgi:hypothetical protein
MQRKKHTDEQRSWLIASEGQGVCCPAQHFGALGCMYCLREKAWLFGERTAANGAIRARVVIRAP